MEFRYALIQHRQFITKFHFLLSSTTIYLFFGDNKLQAVYGALLDQT